MLMKKKQITVLLIFFVWGLLLACEKKTTSFERNVDWWKENYVVEQITSNIYLIEVHEPRQDTNVTLVTSPEGNLIIDSGWAEEVDHLKAIIQDINFDSIMFIISTHIHPDHSGGVAIIDDEGTIIAHENESSVYQWAVPGVDVETFTGEHRFTFNGEEVICRTMPEHGHKMSEIITYFSTSKVLLLGDQYLSGSFPSVTVGNGVSVQGLFTNLDSIALAYPDDVTIIPGHGRATTLDEFKTWIETMKTTVDVVREQIDLGRTYVEICADSVLAAYDMWETLPGLTTEYWIGSIWDSYSGE